jgi:large subunit ribosomal protein L35
MPGALKTDTTIYHRIPYEYKPPNERFHFAFSTESTSANGRRFLEYWVSTLWYFPDSKGEQAMPKMKTHKGTRKRFRLTANGKVKHRGAGTSHLATGMSQKRKRKLRGTRVLKPGMVTNITIALNHNSL